MAALKPEIRRQLQEFLQPLMQEERQRRALVKAALGGASIFRSIDFGGTPYQFTVELIDGLAGSTEEVLPGMPPLAALLDECRRYAIGINAQAQFDALCQVVGAQAQGRDWTGCPYPGLEAFTEAEAPVFFGRTREVRDLVHMLAQPERNAVFVIGDSGSGKSSLVAAGLIPSLRQGAVPGSSDWLIFRTVPGKVRDPFLSLAFALDRVLERTGQRPGDVAGKLAGRSEDWKGIVDVLLRERPAGSEFLLFLDQMEELFTLNDQERVAAFVDLLDAMADDGRVRIVATLRADFYPNCLAHGTLIRRLRQGAFPIGVPDTLSLYRMIVEPAAVAGLTLETGLPERILRDTGTAPGALALMAYALKELWQRRNDAFLSLESYERFGGVTGAIGRRAEEVFEKLGEAARGSLDDVFRELVAVGDDRKATRARASLSKVGAAPAAREFIDAFSKWDARLLVTSGSEHEATVEVAHEALFSSWERLAQWIEQRGDDLRLVRQAQIAAKQWTDAGHDPSHLWPHERLVPVFEALSRLGMSRESLEEPTRSFLRPEAERLLEELDRPETTHYRRAEIGDRLERIGDPRPGIGLRADGAPDIVWREIPVGMVRLEDVDGEFKVERFFIAKYPVTYRQYKAFLDDPQGYANKKRWWKGLQREKEPGDQYRPTGNCPADNVSWNDAMAYCRWASERLGCDVRLPTEMEWQQAACGGNPDNYYPWGGDWVEDRANTNESRLSRTTAVGMYPRGASVQGVLDLSGNVWEWCLNKYAKPNDKSVGGDDRRAVCGGSWVDRSKNTRCTSRNDDYLLPHERYDGVGFRLLCVSSIP